jgi:hypothetical protein
VGSADLSLVNRVSCRLMRCFIVGYGFPGILEMIVIGTLALAPIVSVVLVILVIVVALRSGEKPRIHACRHCGRVFAIGDRGCSKCGRDLNGTC